MSIFGFNFGQNADIDIILDGQDERKMAEIKDENGRKERHLLYLDGESVTGKVNVTLHRKTNRLEHQGIRIELVGQIELYFDRGNHHEFLSLVKQLAGPGELTQNTSFDFEFNQVEKPYESYSGANVKLRYFLKVTIVRRINDMTKEMDVLVHTLSTYPEMNNPIKMEVGIEECLHIEFEYNKSKYHLKDVIVGKIYFLLVRIKIRHMEIAIIKRETTGSGPNTYHDNEPIAKYEIMDGAPVKGESIPIRVFLAGYDLTPTMRDINKKFSVKYYLNLVIVDEEDRRYFKQQEITLWRKGDRIRKGQSMAGPMGMASYNPQAHQLPHAMSRHAAGDTPSVNVRTAPTPSEPNTPVGMPAGGMIHQQQAQQQVYQQQHIPQQQQQPNQQYDQPEQPVLSVPSPSPPQTTTEEAAEVVAEESPVRQQEQPQPVVANEEAERPSKDETVTEGQEDKPKEVSSVEEARKAVEDVKISDTTTSTTVVKDEETAAAVAAVVPPPPPTVERQNGDGMSDTNGETGPGSPEVEAAKTEVKKEEVKTEVKAEAKEVSSPEKFRDSPPPMPEADEEDEKVNMAPSPPPMDLDDDVEEDSEEILAPGVPEDDLSSTSETTTAQKQQKQEALPS